MKYKVFPLQEVLITVICEGDFLIRKIRPRFINSLIPNTDINNLPEEIPEEAKRGLPEGAKQLIIVNKYERSESNRKDCIIFYKQRNNGSIKCEICNFNFGSIYGEEFSDKINIHHIKPLSEIGENYEVDPTKDLIPVCPNCHLILHSKANNDTYTCEEVRIMINNTSNKLLI